MAQTNREYDVIYIDPMFPEKAGAAAVRGPMQYVPRVLTDPLLDFRNREALHRLGYLAEGQWQNDETEERSTPEERGD